MCFELLSYYKNGIENGLSQTFVESSVPPEYPRGLQLWCGRHGLYGHISLAIPPLGAGVLPHRIQRIP